MKQIIIKCEMSNGFEYNSYTEYDNVEEAAAAFKRLTSEACQDYPGVMPTYTGSENFLERNFLIEDGKGNGVRYLMTEESAMMDAIMDAVDISSDSEDFEYFGENYYTMSVPVLNLDSHGKLIHWDDNDDLFYYEILYVNRRPYDLECPQDNDYVYDVHMHQIPRREVEDVNCEIETRSVYVESLEQVGMSILVEIFMNL